MLANPINLEEKFNKFSKHWSPRVIVEMNDYQFKLVKIQGEFTWYDHPNTDEVFIVIEGSMQIELGCQRNYLSAGEMFVVPKEVEHKPFVENECKIMVVEPQGVVNTGEAGGQLKAPNDIQI